MNSNNTDVLSREILSLAGGQRRAKKPKFFDSDDDSDVEIGQIDSPAASSASESDNYDDDLMGDEEDRRYLSKVTEVEREAILFERSEARRIRQERKALKRKLVQREAAPAAAKKKAEQKKRRQQQEEEDDDLSHQDSDSSTYEEEPESRKRSYGQHQQQQHSAPVHHAALEEMNFDQALQITLSRTQLEKLLPRIFLEEAVSDAFVRISSGTREDGTPLYRFAQIHSVTDYPKAYRLNGTETNKALVLLYGKAKKAFRLDLLSNSPPTESEFKRWKWEMQQCSLSLPKAFQAQEKAQQIKSFEGKAVTDQEIDQLLLKKKHTKSSRNTALQKIDLLGQRELALQAEDEAEVARIDSQLALIEQEALSRTTTTPKTKEKIVYFGATTTLNNSTNSASFNATGMNSNNLQTDSTLDPFARRKCNPTIIHAANMRDSAEDLTTSKVGSKETGTQLLMIPLGAVDWESLHAGFSLDLNGAFADIAIEQKNNSEQQHAFQVHNQRYNLW